MERPKKERMVMITFHLPKWMLEMVDELVRRGVYRNRSAAIRDAIAELLRKTCKPSIDGQNEDNIILLRGRW